MMKRLFIFAGYDKQGIIDNTLLHYLNCLSGLGDIVLTMDSDVSDSEIAKLKSVKNILSVITGRHNEYDFGSYKRGFQYAQKQKLLTKYDWVYFVNDSVYGPLWDIEPVLLSLESRGVDLTGMVDFINAETPIQVQSWFVGVSKQVVNEKFFADFMNSVTRQIDKQLVILKYEVGLSQIILRHGYKMSTWVSGQDGRICHSMYKEPLEMLKCGIPFVKKAGLVNLKGIQFLYPFANDKIVDDVARYVIRNNLPFVDAKRPPYIKYFRFTLLGFPLVTIYHQNAAQHVDNYKIYLFDKLPIFKMALNKE